MATIEDFRKAGEKVRNWGRWGPDDEIGTLNFITAEKIRQAAGLVKQGKVFPLGIDFNAYGPQGAHGFRRNPIHLMSIDGGDAEMAQHLTGWGGATEAQMAHLFTAGPMRFNDDYIFTKN